jgi:hypothetical protein
MADLVPNYEIWLNENSKVLSFHYVSQFMHKRFNDYKQFINYVLWKSQIGFKIQ